MFQSRKQFSAASKNVFCAAPAPLLWKGLFYFIPFLTLVLIALAGYMIFKMYKNRKKRKKAIDKTVKIILLWFSVVFLSLVAYGLVGLDFNFYLLVFFIISLLVLGAFFLAEHLKLFQVRRSIWIIFTILALLFAAFFIVCFIGDIRDDVEFANGSKVNCLDRSLF